jgi:L-lysine 2,3-aminomutase
LYERNLWPYYHFSVRKSKEMSHFVFTIPTVHSLLKNRGVKAR